MSDYDHLVHFEEGAHSDSTDDPDREVRSPGSVMSDNYYKDPDGNEDHQDSGDNFGEPEDDGDPPEDEDSEPKDDLYKAIVAPRRNLRLGIASAIPSKATTQLQPVVRNSNRPAPAGSKLPENIDTCLDELGLKPSTDSPAARIDFNNDVKAYLAEKLKQKKKDQPTLDTLVTEFGKQYGLKYWGCNNRGRLANPNVETGISWTRELRDQNSR